MKVKFGGKYQNTSMAQPQEIAVEVKCRHSKCTPQEGTPEPWKNDIALVKLTEAPKKTGM